MSDELKPCPFCGGKATVDQQYDETWDGEEAGVDLYCDIGCENDDCGVKPSVSSWDSTYEDAVERWNTRKGEERQ